MKALSRITAAMLIYCIFAAVLPILGLISSSVAIAQGAGQGGYSGLGGLGVQSQIGLGGLGMDTLVPGMFAMMSGIGSISLLGMGAGYPMLDPLVQSAYVPYMSAGNTIYGMGGTGASILGTPSMGLSVPSPYGMGYYPSYMQAPMYYAFSGITPLMSYMTMPFFNAYNMYPYFGNIPVFPISAYGYSGYNALGGISGDRYALGSVNLGGFIDFPVAPWTNLVGANIPIGLYMQIPGTISILLYGYVYDDSQIPIPLDDVYIGVQSNNDISTYTRTDGFYKIRLFPETYTLVYSKEGYETQELTLSVWRNTNSYISPIYMKAIDHTKPENHAPKLDPIDAIEAYVGDTVEIVSIAYDQDTNAVLKLSYSEWITKEFVIIPKNGKCTHIESFLVTEADIGEHLVRIKVEDEYEEFDTHDVLITVYKGEKHPIQLYVGFNLISYPFEYGDSDFTAFDLLEMLGNPNQISSVENYDGSEAYYNEEGEPDGENFTIGIDEGYIVYAKEDRVSMVPDRYTKNSQPIYLLKGVNLIGITEYPEGYTSYDLLYELGYEYADSVNKFDAYCGEWRSAYWLNKRAAGDEFPILIGEGYIIQMKQNKNLDLSRQRFFTF